MDALERVVVMKCTGLYVVRKCHSVLCIEVFRVWTLALSIRQSEKYVRCEYCTYAKDLLQYDVMQHTTLNLLV
jgi:hypothetical protein